MIKQGLDAAVQVPAIRRIRGYLRMTLRPPSAAWHYAA